MFIDIEESSKMTAEKLCKILEQHGVYVMKESSSRSKHQYKHSLACKETYFCVRSLVDICFCRIRIVLHHQISSDDAKFVVSCFQVLIKHVIRISSFFFFSFVFIDFASLTIPFGFSLFGLEFCS